MYCGIQKSKHMNTLKNTVQLIGHLGQDVTYSNFESGTTKAAFSLATNDYYKNNKGEKVQDTQWHNVIAWGKLADNMNSMLSKGAEVVVKGKLTSRSYEDKDGQKRFVTEIVAKEFLAMEKKSLAF